MRFRWPNRLLVFGAICAVSAAQTPAPLRNFNTIPHAAVPSDPLELVTGPAQPVQNAEQRAAAIAMIGKARALSNVRAHPYDLKTNFAASGRLASDGNWSLEDMSRGRAYRWTAQGPNYSVVNLYPSSTMGSLYSNRAGSDMPLRLLQARDALFFVYPQGIGPQASIRLFSANLDGAAQQCILLVFGAGSRVFTGERNWEETEFCIDAKTGLLTTFSRVPGLYVHYDYSTGIKFHEQTIPTAFTITEAGQTVLEAKTVSVADPPDANDPVFNPAGLSPVGAGREMNPAARIGIFTGAGPQGRNRTTAGDLSMQTVALHGTVGSDGQLIESEILASSDPGLNENALKQAATMLRQRAGGQPGATPQSQEVILTFNFITGR